MSLRPCALSRCIRSVGRFWRNPIWSGKKPFTPLPLPATVRLPKTGFCSRYHLGQKRWLSNVHDVENEQSPVQNEQAVVHEDESTPALIACPGCGALAQTVESGEAGYYSTRRKIVRNFSTPADPAKEDQIAAQALGQADPELLLSLGLSIPAADGTSPNVLFMVTAWLIFM